MKSHIKPCTCITCKKAREEQFKRGIEVGYRKSAKDARKLLNSLDIK